MVKVLLALMVKSLHAKSALVVKLPSMMASKEDVGPVVLDQVVV